MDWNVIAPQVVTAISTLIAGPLFGVATASYRRKSNSKALRAALVAEISALLKIVEERQYLQGLREGAQGMYESMTVKVAENFTLVYRANLDRIGILLPEDAENIVLFHVIMEALRQDIISGGFLNDPEVSLEERKEGFSESARLLEKAIAIGANLRGT